MLSFNTFGLMGHEKSVMRDCRGARLRGLVQKGGWSIPGEDLGLGQLCVALLKKSLSNLCVGESTALSCCCAFQLTWHNLRESREQPRKATCPPCGLAHGRQIVAVI